MDGNAYAPDQNWNNQFWNDNFRNDYQQYWKNYRSNVNGNLKTSGAFGTSGMLNSNNSSGSAQAGTYLNGSIGQTINGQPGAQIGSGIGLGIQGTNSASQNLGGSIGQAVGGQAGARVGAAVGGAIGDGR
ncbi:MAG: hypothetical protein R3C53_27010 [Pirellulaceae bacterium]